MPFKYVHVHVCTYVHTCTYVHIGKGFPVQYILRIMLETRDLCYQESITA